MVKMEKEINYKNTDLMGCLHWTFKIMTYAAYWLPKNATKWQTVYFFVMSVATTYFSVCTEVAFLLFKARTLEEIVDCSFVLLTHASQAIKLSSFYIGRERLLSLLDLLETDMFKPKNIRQYKSTVSIRDYTSKFGYIYLRVVCFCVILVAVFPAIEKKDAKVLPVRAAWPFKFTETHYGIVYAYQAITGLTMAVANVATDLTAVAFMSQLCIQLEILSDNVVHIKELAEESLKLKGNAVANRRRDDIYPELQEEMSATLKSCVKHHLVIRDFVKEVQSVFSIPIFFQLFAAVGTICMTLFQLSLVTNYFTVRFASLVMYMCCMVMEISVFCWYGNDSTVRNKKLSASVYNTDWVECSVEYKKMVLFLMAHMQRVIRIRVGHLVDLTLQNLVLVYRTSWSYFLVLHSMRD